ncbi:MAG: NADH:flavin oxidoreductase [Bryobacterales bacterium]
MPADLIFEPLSCRNLTVKNRIFRSNISGRFDNYDGSGNQARINWELKFARGGVGAIISSFVPVHIHGRIIPNYATIERDDRIPFWRELGKRVHEHDCKFILQLSHAGRQRDIGGIEYDKGLSSTDKPEELHGFECERMTVAQIQETVAAFAQGARRAREAGLDGVELHGANGYLITQFLSSAITDRDDEYGGPLENRARFVREIVRAIRAEVGNDFHLQMKISAVEHHGILSFFQKSAKQGNTLEESKQVCKWLEEDGVDAIHVSTGSSFPHPLNPAGDLPLDHAVKTYDTVISSGLNTYRNYRIFRNAKLGALFRRMWVEAHDWQIEGRLLPEAHAIKATVGIPVFCTGGFQTASVIRDALKLGMCDAVTIARPLVANNDLVKMFAAGVNAPENPCTYCNKCLVNVTENPLGCYEESRYNSRAEMIEEIMSVFQPAPFSAQNSSAAAGDGP